MSSGARRLRDLEGVVVAVRCERCGRAGRYAKTTLERRYGAATPAPDVLVRLAPDSACDRWKDRLAGHGCAPYYGRPAEDTER